MLAQIATVLLLSTSVLSWPVPSQEIIDNAFSPSFMLMGLTSDLGPDAMKSLEDFQYEFDVNLADAFLPEDLSALEPYPDAPGYVLEPSPSVDESLDNLELDFPALVDMRKQLLAFSDEISDILGDGGYDDSDYPSLLELGWS